MCKLSAVAKIIQWLKKVPQEKYIAVEVVSTVSTVSTL